jgi:hypothetical protein
VVSPDREDVVAMLATYGNREVGAVRERIDSLDLAWLVHQVEQRYSVTLDLSDDELARMSTVSGAVEVLGEAMPNGHGPAGGQGGAGRGNGVNGGGPAGGQSGAGGHD